MIIGFIGVYVILNPDFNNFNYLSLTPVFCAFCYALSMIILKKTSDSEKLFLQTITENDSKQDAVKAEELVKQITAKRKRIVILFILQLLL